MQNESFTAEELARWLHVDDRNTVYLLRDSGMPAFKPEGGNKYRYSADSVLSWLRSPSAGEILNAPDWAASFSAEEHRQLLILHQSPVYALKPGKRQAVAIETRNTGGVLEIMSSRDLTAQIVALIGVLEEGTKEELRAALGVPATYLTGHLLRDALRDVPEVARVCTHLVQHGTVDDLENWLLAVGTTPSLWLTLLLLDFPKLERNPYFGEHRLDARIPTDCGSVWITFKMNPELQREWAMRDNPKNTLLYFEPEEIAKDLEGRCSEIVRYFVEEHAEVHAAAARAGGTREGISTAGLPTVKVAVDEYVRKHPTDPTRTVYVRSFVNTQHVAHPERYTPDSDGVAQPLAPVAR
jgi:hypothetical protein